MTVGAGELDEANSMPLFLRYDGKTGGFRKFSAEIDFESATRDYSNYPEGQQFDYARLELLINEDNQVTSHKVSPYKILYRSEADIEGYPVFEKYGKPLQIDDKVAIYSDGIDLGTRKHFWNPESDFITVTEAPTFIFEALEFVDESGNLFDYHYFLRAKDMAGNTTDTTPQIAITTSNKNSK